MITLIKKYWMVLVGIFAAIMGLLFILKAKKEKTVDTDLPEVKEKIDINNKEIEVVDKKIETVQEEKIEVKKKITDKKELVKMLEDSKKNIVAEEKTVSEAKSNILNKTKRRR